jgi:hypothetical protein
MQHIAEVIAGLPAGLRALGAGVLGAAAASLWRFGVARLLAVARFDAACERLGVGEFLRKGRVRHGPSALAGFLGFWTILLLGLLVVARILDITVLNELAARLAALAPGLLAGVFIIAIGLVIVAFLANFVMTVARNAGSAHATLYARMVRGAGVVLVIVLALRQLEVDGNIVGTMFLLLFGAAVFGLALAFGLGCKDMARDAAARVIKRIRERERQDGHEDLEG